MSHSTLSRLSNDQLMRNLDRLVSTERTRLVDVLHHLNEIDERRLCLAQGFRSLFCYCTERLRYSESAAGRRIAVARALRRAPEIGPMLVTGEVNLTTVALVAGLLTHTTKEKLLDRIRGKSRTEVERIVSEYRPRPVVRDRVRAVCAAQPVASASALTFTPADDASSSDCVPTARATITAESAPGNAREEAAADDVHADSQSGGKAVPLQNSVGDTHLVCTHEIRFAAGDDFVKKLARARVLLSNRLPAATFEQVFDAAIETFLDANCPIRRKRRREERQAKKRRRTDGNAEIADTDSNTEIADTDSNTEIADTDSNTGALDTDSNTEITDTGGNAGATTGGDSLPLVGVEHGSVRTTRHIPAAVRDAVYVRDRGRCAYLGPTGKRCNARRFLQVDHVEPYSHGGGNHISNLRLLCRAHNRVAAEQVLGRHVMARYFRRE